MSTNQKIVLLIVLVGAVTGIAIYEGQSTPPEPDQFEKESTSDDGNSQDSMTADSGSDSPDIFSKPSTDRSNSDNQSSATSGSSDTSSTSGTSVTSGTFDNSSNSGSSGDSNAADRSLSGSSSSSNSGDQQEFIDEDLTEDEIAGARHTAEDGSSDGFSGETDNSDSSVVQDSPVPPLGNGSGTAQSNQDESTQGDKKKEVAAATNTGDTGSGTASSSSGIQNSDQTSTSSSTGGTGSGSGSGTYEVKDGDNLWKISKKFYGSGSKWKKIKRANPDKLSKSNNLKRGMTLTIPAETEERDSTIETSADLAGEQSVTSRDESNSTGTSSSSSDTTYEVKDGDRLWDIVERNYGSVTYDRVQKIAEMNDIRPRELRPGMKITLPSDLGGSGSDSGSDTSDASANSGTSNQDEPPFEAGSDKKWYRVKRGESLWKISKNEYGTGKYFPKIWELNKDRLEDYNSVPSGRWVLLPKNP